MKVVPLLITILFLSLLGAGTIMFFMWLFNSFPYPR